MTSKHEIATIVREYPANFQPTRIEPLGSAGGMSGAQFWRLESTRGPLVLRRWPAEHPSSERLRFIHQVLFYAAQRGAAFLAIPIRTASGASFLESGGHLWELAPWMPGTADYERSPTKEKLSAATTALAQFHLAAQDSSSTAPRSVDGAVSAISRHLARLKELSKRGVDELSPATTDAAWHELAPLARRFLATVPGHLPRAIGELEPLAGISLPLQPCLRDIWHDHVLFTGDNVTGIIDFGAVNIDTPATDIARLLGSFAGDDAVRWRDGLTAYSQARPLTADEECAVIALDASGTILAGCNWLRWIYIEGRQFANPAQVIERFRRIVGRCDLVVGS